MSIQILNPTLGTSFLTRANPLSKLAAGLILTLAVVLSVDWVSASVVLLGELVLLPVLGVKPGPMFKRLWPLLIGAVLAGYGTALLASKTGVVLFALGPLVLTSNSLLAGVAIALRALALGIPGYLLMTTTDPTDMAHALTQKLKLPQRFVLGTLAAMRLVGLMAEQWQVLSLARRARGVGADNSWLARFRNFFGQLVALLVLALRRASALAIAMQARGFGAQKRTWVRQSVFSVQDVWVVAYAVVVAALAVSLAVWAHTWNFVMS